MSKYSFLGDELGFGFNSIYEDYPFGLLVFEEDGKKFFKTISEKGTSSIKHKVGSSCEIVLDTTSGKVFFRPTAERAAADPRYAIITPPIWEENLDTLAPFLRNLRKIAGNNERFFGHGTEAQGFYHPVYEQDAINMAKEKGYKKIYNAGINIVKLPKRIDLKLDDLDRAKRNAAILALKEKRSVSYESGSETSIITLDEAKKLASRYIEKSLKDLEQYNKEFSKIITSIKNDLQEMIQANDL